MRTVGIYTNCINCGVSTNAARQTFDCLYGIFSIKIDHFCSLILGHRKARGNGIDGKNAPCIQEFCTGDNKLAYRTAAKDDHCMAWLDIGHICSKVSGGKDIRKQNGLVVNDLMRQLDQPDVREGDTCLFHLKAVERSGLFGAAKEGRACRGTIGISIITLGIVASATVGTVTTGNCRSNYYAVSNVQVSDIRANCFNGTNTFMSQDCARNHATKGATYHMQISAANGAGCETYNGIGWLFNLWFGNILQADITDCMKNYCFHMKYYVA